MAKLTVEDFSCINKAELELGEMTVIIGPQASGKSILSKLCYFFYSLLNDQYQFIEEGKKLDAFKSHIREKFGEWFPASAWGSKKFCIHFVAGAFDIRLTRVIYRGKLNTEFRISLSSYIEDHYQDLLNTFETVSTKTSSEELTWEATYEVREISRKKLSKELGKEFIRNQLFIPAGRSFFTNIGKAVAAFEHTRMLDPLTTTFGRNFAASKDRHFYTMSQQKSKRSTISRLTEEILGGKVKVERNREYVETKDGRKIPFSALSSGQQELFPLLLMLSTYFAQTTRRSNTDKRLVYIEEPEAHLFPSAQSSLIMVLAEIVASSKDQLDMVITTHSPYILSKLNNLLKAGEIFERHGQKAQSHIEHIIPKEYWLSPKKFKAYAIIDGEVKSICNDEGLIDGSYLDDISGDISREFTSLLTVDITHERY